MAVTFLLLIAAAGLEVGGDAAIRTGLTRGAVGWLASGAAALVAYGVVVNANRGIDFGRLLGIYIAVFFVVSQAIAFVGFGERPSASLLLGGALIVAGGVVIQLGVR